MFLYLVTIILSIFSDNITITTDALYKDILTKYDNMYQENAQKCPRVMQEILNNAANTVDETMNMQDKDKKHKILETIYKVDGAVILSREGKLTPIQKKQLMQMCQQEQTVREKQKQKQKQTQFIRGFFSAGEKKIQLPNYIASIPKIDQQQQSLYNQSSPFPNTKQSLPLDGTTSPYQKALNYIRGGVTTSSPFNF